jgi:hypothetical protein
MNENTYKLVAVVLLCTTIGAGALAVNYNYQLRELEEDYKTVLDELQDYTSLVNIMVDYGNGTLVWYNETRTQLGASVLDATLIVCDTEFDTFDFGSFVTSINGLEQDASHFWGWSIYEDEWVMGPVGADQHRIHDGDIIGWTFTSF